MVSDKMRRSKWWLIASLWLSAGCGVPSLTYVDGRTEVGDASLDAAPPDDGEAESSAISSIDSTLAFDAPGNAAEAAVVVSCDNGIQDGDETAIDCGGTRCRRCGTSSACKVDNDCISAFCNRTSCAMPSCADLIKNLDETDIDCGGSECHPCGLGAACKRAEDCTVKNCVNSKCQAASCNDKQQTGGETDVDCGGPDCAACAASKMCLVGRDCASTVCGADQRCATISCTDRVVNGDETDQDCGGTTCPQCADGQACATGADCVSGVCGTHVCQPATCTDGVKNGTELGVDCRGGCPTGCGTDQACTSDADCASQNCNVTCQPCPRDMVHVTSAAVAYCIDGTEVTIDAYAKFLQAPPKATSVPAVCAFKQSYQPGARLDMNRPRLPVSNVDWCDAATFCAEKGRHLCGRMGDRTPLTSPDLQNHTKSEWFHACSGPNNRVYPYGDMFDASKCQGRDRFSNNQGPTNTGGNSCEGSVPGLFDMSGNIAEWEDDCVGTAGPSDDCNVRGGSFQDGGFQVRCTSLRTVKRSTANDAAIGFRCCL